ncbi:MAG: RHS repeat-associated core domain-containing protein [Acidobacteriota bacterium]|nr:RHS repeat-associated core domain-containing protein [Acidobacteriota bacterium]
MTGTPTAFHDWNLDEVGNWREHKESESEAFWTPEVDPINAYDKWDASFDRDGDGVEEALTLVREHDAARGFLFRKEEEDGTHTRYVHDALGRLVEVQRETGGGPETVVRYGYDTSGRLSWREEAGGDGKTWLVHDGGSTVLEIADESTGRRGVWVNVWAGSTLVRAKDTNGKVVYLHQDRLGSIVAATRDENGAAVMDGGAAYDPYGRKVILPDWSPGELAVPYGYAGARLEPLSAADIDRDGDGIAEERRALYLMGARWYDPQTGRFIEQDPIGEDGGLNLYAYTGSSPISWIDPTGLAKKKAKEMNLDRQRQEKSSWRVDGVRVSASFARFVARSVEGGREARAWRVQRDAPLLAEKMKAAAKQLDAQAAASEGDDAEKNRALADTLRQGATLLEGMAEAAAQGPETLERFGQENANALREVERRLTEQSEVSAAQDSGDVSVFAAESRPQRCIN